MVWVMVTVVDLEKGVEEVVRVVVGKEMVVRWEVAVVVVDTILVV